MEQSVGACKETELVGLLGLTTTNFYCTVGHDDIVIHITCIIKCRGFSGVGRFFCHVKALFS